MRDEGERHQLSSNNVPLIIALQTVAPACSVGLGIAYPPLVFSQGGRESGDRAGPGLTRPASAPTFVQRQRELMNQGGRLMHLRIVRAFRICAVAFSSFSTQPPIHRAGAL